VFFLAPLLVSRRIFTGLYRARPWGARPPPAVRPCRGHRHVPVSRLAARQRAVPPGIRASRLHTPRHVAGLRGKASIKRAEFRSRAPSSREHGRALARQRQTVFIRRTAARRRFGLRSDLFAVGVILYELLILSSAGGRASGRGRCPDRRVRGAAGGVYVRIPPGLALTRDVIARGRALGPARLCPSRGPSACPPSPDESAACPDRTSCAPGRRVAPHVGYRMYLWCTRLVRPYAGREPPRA